jgi:hypothetical protein
VLKYSVFFWNAFMNYTTARGNKRVNFPEVLHPAAMSQLFPATVSASGIAVNHYNANK